MSNETTKRTQSNRSWFNNHCYLLYAASPFLVYGLALVLFTLGMAEDRGFELAVHELVAAETEVNNEDRLREVAARYTWLTAVLLYVVSMAAATIASCRIMFQTHGKDRIKPVAMACSILCLISVLSLVLDIMMGGAQLRGIYAFTFDALPRSSSTADAGFQGNIRLVVSCINVFSVIAPVFVIVAACSCLAPPKSGQFSEQELAHRMQLLKTTVAVGALVLATGVLHMGAWLQWPSALVDDKAKASIGDLALSITTFWGATFSVIAVVTFIPLQMQLRRCSMQLVETTIADATERNKWLKDNGFTLTPAQHLRNLTAMLAPLLTVPLGGVIAKIAGSG